MAKVLSVANQKGGVGKTTTVYNLAASLAGAGKTVLMIDMDPQSSLTLSCAIEPDVEPYASMDSRTLFRNNVDPLDCCFTVDALKTTALYIIPAVQDLALTVLRLSTQTGAILNFKNNIGKLRPHFDYIFLDCPPSLDELLTSSLVSSDGVIIPVKPERLSYAGLKLIIPTINAVQNEDAGRLGNKDLKIEGLIATMFRSNVSEHKAYLDQIAREFNLLGTIPLSSTVTKEVDKGLPVVIAHPSSSAAKEYEHIAFMM